MMITRRRVRLDTPGLRRTRGAPASALLTSLVAHWKLDEASGTRNDSHGTNHLTDNNTVTTGTAKLGTNAAQFTAANSEYLSVADNAALSMGNIDFTIAFWLNLDTVASSQDLFNKCGGASGSDKEYRIYLNNASGNVLTFQVGDNAAASVAVDSGSAISAATWYFVVCSHDSVANQVAVQIDNGTAATAAYSGGSHDGTQPLNIGVSIANGSFYANGRMDSISLWKRMLTSGELTSLFGGGSGLEYPF